MSHLIITRKTTNMKMAMTTTSTMVVPAATGRTDEPALKTKWYILILHSINNYVSAATK